jgi:two-component system sensor histidine kinase/response regulator
MKLLVIEDNPPDVELIREMLSDHQDFSSEIVHGDRLSAGIEILAREPIDCILLDLGLPDSQGIDTVKAVRHEYPRKPIVVLTGQDNIETGIRALQEGAQDYLVKSQLNPLILIRSIRYAIERNHHEEELLKVTENLKRSNSELERFAYVASHDLQEPLRNIISFSQLLVRRYQGRLDDDADEFIGYIVEGGKRMQHLVNDLLEYSRVETRGKPLESTDCREVFETAMRNLYNQIQINHAVITADPLPVVRADPVQLGMVFQNLIGNAIKFRKDNEQPRIHISAEKIDTAWKVAIRDNGIGIDPAFFDRIFEIFQRLHTREKFPGTGVGLAIVKKIVERHGGEVWVESEPGVGSTFYFTLPAADSIPTG